MNYWFVITEICQMIRGVKRTETPIVEVETPEGLQLYFHRVESIGDTTNIKFWLQYSMVLHLTSSIRTAKN